MLKHLYLIDHKPKLVRAWQEAFEIFDEVTAIQGDYFTQSTDAMISPANSFGIMDGGLDRAIRDTLGFEITNRLQDRILEEFYGELPVGSAITIETNNNKWPWLIVAPTMRIPESVNHTLNAYISFRAILNEIRLHNLSSKSKIETLVCPGLGTGIGLMDVRKCAGQMRAAYTMFKAPPRIGSFDHIHKVDRTLKTI